LGFRAEACTPDAFELEYFIPFTIDDIDSTTIDQLGELKIDDVDYAHIAITKVIGSSPKVHCKNLPFLNERDGFLGRRRIKRLLPKYVIGYSSGSNEILSLPFFKMRFIHFDEYRDHLIKDVPYDGKPEGRMIYVDDQFSQAILICHFLFPTGAVTRVFQEKVGVSGIRRFRIIIRRQHRIPVAGERFESMPAEDQKDKTKNTVELTSKLSGYFDDKNELQPDLIDKLVKCSTTHHEDYSAYPDGEGFDLYLDYWVNDATKRAFQVHFGEASGGSEEFNKAKSALNLFQAFQTLLTLNHYKVDEKTKAELYQSSSLYVNETISTPASDERITRFKEGELIKEGVTDRLYVKALSDGEHQLLHTIGLCLLYRHESALFLLDEPETHLNPDWRASYISTLRAALEADGSARQVMREVLLTSHSPFIISDCSKDFVLVFNNDITSQAVRWQRPDFETFGASVNAITMKVFGHTETIGDYAMARIIDLRKRLDDGGDPDQLIGEAGKELGDSVEKVLFVNQALDKKEGK
jgi:restriction system-associated AAA family ATPase